MRAPIVVDEEEQPPQNVGVPNNMLAELHRARMARNNAAVASRMNIR